MATLSPSAYRTIRYEWIAEFTANITQNAYSSTVNAVMAPEELEPTPNTPVPTSNPPSIAVGTANEPHHQNATYLSGGDCRRGRSTNWGVQLCTWPYTMMKIAKKAPVRVRLHPIPEAGSLRKNGRGTSNHRSLDPNRKTLDSDSTLILYLFLNS